MAFIFFPTIIEFPSVKIGILNKHAKMIEMSYGEDLMLPSPLALPGPPPLLSQTMYLFFYVEKSSALVGHKINRKGITTSVNCHSANFPIVLLKAVGHWGPSNANL